MGIKSADLKDKFCTSVLRLSNLTGCKERPQTAICCFEWLGRLSLQSLLWMRPCHWFLCCEGVLGIGHQVIFLFRQCITYCYNFYHQRFTTTLSHSFVLLRISKVLIGFCLVASGVILAYWKEYSELWGVVPFLSSRYQPKLFKLMIKALNFATTLMTLRLTFSDIGTIQINFWWGEPRMSEIC